LVQTKALDEDNTRTARAAQQRGRKTFRGQLLAETARSKTTPAKKDGPNDTMAEPVRPSQPAARNTAPAAGKKPTSKKGGGKREEHTVAISSQVYGLVKNYKINGGDNVLPKISGVLRATGALVQQSWTFSAFLRRHLIVKMKQT
jgi:hypothetical protein